MNKIGRVKIRVNTKSNEKDILRLITTLTYKYETELQCKKDVLSGWHSNMANQ